jgi:glycosyltransferase involved in cell wall biosynthesis
MRVLVIPCHNERKTVGLVVEATKVFFDRVVVYDDASDDGSGKIAADAGADVVTGDINIGYSEALRRGVVVAISLGANHIVCMDADGQHQTDHVRIVSERLKGDVKLVVTKRDKKQRKAEVLASILYSALYSVSDPFSGLKGFSREVGELAVKKNMCVGLRIISAYRSLRNPNGKLVQVDINCPQRIGIPKFYSGLKGELVLLGAMIRVQLF